MLRNRHRLRLPRIPRVLIATLTLAFALAMTVYAAHIHERSAKSAVTHCEVCLHLSGAQVPLPRRRWPALSLSSHSKPSSNASNRLSSNIGPGHIAAARRLSLLNRIAED